MKNFTLKGLNFFKPLIFVVLFFITQSIFSKFFKNITAPEIKFWEMIDAFFVFESRGKLYCQIKKYYHSRFFSESLERSMNTMIVFVPNLNSLIYCKLAFLKNENL